GVWVPALVAALAITLKLTNLAAVLAMLLYVLIHTLRTHKGASEPRSPWPTLRSAGIIGAASAAAAGAWVLVVNRVATLPISAINQVQVFHADHLTVAQVAQQISVLLPPF